MIRKIVKKTSSAGIREKKVNLEYWLSRSPEERMAAVDFLRDQINGTKRRLQRVGRVIQRQRS